MTYDLINTNIKYIRSGDTIFHNDEIKTVSNNDIKKGFMGFTIFGDSYNLGYLPVKKVINIKG